MEAVFTSARFSLTAKVSHGTSLYICYFYFSSFGVQVKETEIQFILLFSGRNMAKGEGEITKFYENTSHENRSPHAIDN